MTGTRGDAAGTRTPARQAGEVNGAPDDLPGRGAAWIGVPGASERVGARTPEELETLLEDALMVRDRDGLAALFAEGAVLVAGDDRSAHGGEAIARLALATWAGERVYLADPWRVVQARDLALVVAQGGVNVARRGRDGAWRYAIVVQAVDDGSGRRER